MWQCPLGGVRCKHHWPSLTPLFTGGIPTTSGLSLRIQSAAFSRTLIVWPRIGIREPLCQLLLLESLDVDPFAPAQGTMPKFGDINKFILAMQ